MNLSRPEIAKARGFSLLEFALVLVVVAVLLGMSASYYIQALEEMRRVAVQTQANYFRASVATLRSQWMIDKVHERSSEFVWLDQPVYLNDAGWAANSDAKLSPNYRNQTAFECWQLWKVFLPLENMVTIDGVMAAAHGSYHVSVTDGGNCRYELIGDRNSRHMFDYFPVNGDVAVVTQSTEA